MANTTGSSTRLAAAAISSLLAVGAFVGSISRPDGSTSERVAAAASTCIGSTGAGALTNLFDRAPGGIIAADYQRALSLPDGRTLWTFQDATFQIPSPPPGSSTTQLVHNAALVQTGTCFDRLGAGTEENPASWLLAAETTPFSHWFWPLDATMGSDGLVWVFLAEMVERGPLYLSVTEPIATRAVGLDPTTLQVVRTERPPDDSAALYGFSIAADEDWTYVYAQCHRQFGWDITILGTRAHDFSCSADVTVARVPRGRVLAAPSYWDGTTWQADAARAVPVMPRGLRLINPTQVRWTGTEFLAVTKEGDWFGSTIYLDRAPAAQGPWTTWARVPAVPKCGRTTCNTYFASWVPWLDAGRLIVGLSHNRWDGVVSPVNRPTFLAIDPPGAFPYGSRCAVIDC